MEPEGAGEGAGEGKSWLLGAGAVTGEEKDLGLITNHWCRVRPAAAAGSTCMVAMVMSTVTHSMRRCCLLARCQLATRVQEVIRS